MHVAAADMSLEAVELYADQWDEALRGRTSKGQLLPLHVAAFYRATNGLDPTGVIRSLAVKRPWPPALEERDAIGRPPMHHAAKSSTVEAVEALANMSVQALQERSKDGSLRMHLRWLPATYMTWRTWSRIF